MVSKGFMNETIEVRNRDPGCLRNRLPTAEVYIEEFGKCPASVIFLTPQKQFLHKQTSNMKIIFVVLSVAAVCLALPASPYRQTDDSKTATILQQDYINAGTGYNFAYETSDGSSRQEQAEVKNPGTKDESIVVQGSYSYVGVDGVTYTVNYIADENGYRPTGQHIPSL